MHMEIWWEGLGWSGRLPMCVLGVKKGDFGLTLALF
jgi:hypothetical protein